MKAASEVKPESDVKMNGMSICLGRIESDVVIWWSSIVHEHKHDVLQLPQLPPL